MEKIAPPYPNDFGKLLKHAGLSLKEIHEETGIPESTLRHYKAGKGVIPREIRRKIAQIIGCNTQELAPIIRERNETEQMIIVNTGGQKMNNHATSIFQSDRYFSFGKIKTAEIILDGDGTEIYQPHHIRSHYVPVPLELPEEIATRKEQIAREQEERKAQGDSYQWNGERYNLVKFNIGREPANEEMNLGLWFRPSDYYTFLATSAIAQDQTKREKYLSDVEWDEAIPLFAHSFSILLAVVTCDEQIILVQRGKGLGCRPNVFDVSIAEGLSRPVDRSGSDQAPDVYRCAVRGLAEELGLQEPADFSASDIMLLSFAVDTALCMWGLFGMVKIKRSMQEVLENTRKNARDRFEHRNVFSVPFTPQDVCSFVFSHEPFSPGGLVCLYHSLVHEFGRAEVEQAMRDY